MAHLQFSIQQNRLAKDNAFQTRQSKGTMQNGEILARLAEIRACTAVFVPNDFVFNDGATAGSDLVIRLMR